MDSDKSVKKILISLFAVICLGGALYLLNSVRPDLVSGKAGLVFAPMQQMASSAADKAGGFFAYFRDINSLRAENEELKNELLLARAQSNRLIGIEKENARLTQLMDFKRSYTAYSLVGADITARDAGSWGKGFTINKGTDDGIAKDMPVITADGLVGKIAQCSGGYSQVVTLLDDKDSVSVKSTRTGDVGYISGDRDGDNMCVLTPANQAYEMLEGDEIVTSSLSDIFPQGIMIGRVQAVYAQGDDKYALVEPAVDFMHIENVFVINKNSTADYVNAPAATAPPTEQTSAAPTAEQTTEPQTAAEAATQAKEEEGIPAAMMEPATEE